MTPIAVVGADVHVPGASSFAELTRALRAGRVAARPFPTGRLRDGALLSAPEDHYDGGYFERIDLFDHRAFRLPARLTAEMDPYQRWCLTSSARAVHDAGEARPGAGERVGVYAAVNGLQQSAYATLQRAHGGAPDLLAVLSSGVAARVSHVLDLRGPATVLDTACSSSLYALAVACADLTAGTVDAAVVTAANLYLDPGARGTAAVDVVSETCRTRAFDAAADGTSVGEGVVTLVLRRADDVAGPVYGVVEGWSVGQDGRTATMAAPNPAAQVAVVDTAWAAAGADPADVGLLVSHGTGTAVGDAVELEALASASAFTGVARGSVPLISVKANAGHLDAASGLLSTVAALGALSTGEVPPHPSFVAPSPAGDLVTSPFYVPVEPAPLRAGALAGVSSFGMTGTDVHVVLRGGGRRPGPTADLPLEPRRAWFPVERNTFAKPGSRARTVLGVRTRVHTVETHRDWEIAEHRVAGTPLMVGTAVVEVLARLLDGSDLALPEHDVTDLTILRPLTTTEPLLEVVAAVEESSGRGEVTARAGDEDPEPWVRFRVEPAQGVPPLADAPPDPAGLVPVPVETRVGDDATVSVSGRWQVARAMWRSPDGEEAVLRLAVPPAHAAEAAGYAFYPPVLDAALNGMNALLGAGEVLLPWVCERLVVRVPALPPGELTAHLRHRGTTRDGRGNVIVTVDTDLWDERGRCLVSTRGYRVKNRPDGRAPVLAFHRLVLDAEPTPRTGGAPRRAVVLPASQAAAPWRAAGCVVVGRDDAAAPGVLAGVDEVVVVGDGPDPDVAAGSHALGRLLLHLHTDTEVRTVVLLEPGSLSTGPAVDAAVRARAATGHSLRTEFRFDVAVLDAPAEPASLAALDDHLPEGLLRLEDGVLRAARLREHALEQPRPWTPDATGTVLVVGASRGIGRAYAGWLVERFPGLAVHGAGRSAPDGPLPFAYHRADVTDPASLAALAERVGTPDHVVVLAGEPAGGLFVTKSEETVRARMASKVHGAENVAAAFPGCPDVVLVSSVAGWVGAIGQAEYAAANAYLTGLADRHGGTPFRCIALTGWSEIGMSRDLTDELFVRTTPEEGLPVLHAFVASEERCASLFRLLDGSGAYSPLLAGAAGPAARHAPAPDRTAAVAAPAAPRPAGTARPAEVQAAVLGAWSRVLGPDEYAPDVTFFEYGGDSVSVVRLCDELGRDFPDVFDVTTLFSCATVRDQTQWVERHLEATTASTAVSVDISAIQRLLHANGRSR